MKKNKTKYISNNATFDILFNKFENYFKSNSLVDSRCISHNLTVGGITKNRVVISLELPFNCFIRFGSCEFGEKLELVSIRIAPELQDQGIGTLLMKTMFTFFKDCLGFVPEMQLECTGSIGANDGYLVCPIQKQTKFFRKFGFRVTSKKEYPTYVKMEIDFSKMNMDNLILRRNNQNQEAA